MELASYSLLAFGSLFAILSPLGTVPTFLTITEGGDDEGRLHTARRACTIAFGVLVVFALLGAPILRAFAVSIPALQIAGGLVILRIGLEMLAGHGARRKLSPEERAEALEKDDVAVTPLAVPILCGPGAITTAIVLESQAGGWLQHVVLIAIVALIYAGTFGLLWAAVRYSAFLSVIPLRVVGRLMGLLLATVAVQFLLNGVSGALPQLLPAS